MQIKELLQKSFDIAKKISLEKERNFKLQQVNLKEGDKNAERSKAFVNQISLLLQEYFKEETDVKVFWRDRRPRHEGFPINELLYDIVVSRIDDEPSIRYGKQIPFVKESIWQIECEFARFDAGLIRNIFIDFSKLVLGAAPNKLFIGSWPRTDNIENYKNMVLNIARACKGTVYLSLMPHPDKWNLNNCSNGKLVLWKLKDSWVPMDE